jgi:hypothetical protein
MDVADVYPTADGGAYVISAQGQLWYAKGGEAVRVTELKVSQTRERGASSPAGAAFALLSVERQRSRRLRDEKAALQEELDEVKEKLEESRNDQ